MTHLLDTNTCVYAIKRQPAVQDRLRDHSPEDVCVTTITLAELWFGARKSSRPTSTRHSVDAFLTPISVLEFDARAAESYAEIRLDLERKGRPIGARDLLIASIAKSRSLTVVNHNT